MDDETTMVPVIQVTPPPVKAIDTCSCCGAQGRVAQLKMGWSLPHYSNAGGTSITACFLCLGKAESAISEYIKKAIYEQVEASKADILKISEDVKVSRSTGVMYVRCRNKHEYTVNPAKFDPGDSSAVYGSDADFCPWCGEPIR
jgi:hypothetical protein